MGQFVTHSLQRDERPKPIRIRFVKTKTTKTHLVRLFPLKPPLVTNAQIILWEMMKAQHLLIQLSPRLLDLLRSPLDVAQ